MFVLKSISTHRNNSHKLESQACTYFNRIRCRTKISALHLTEASSTKATSRTDFSGIQQPFLALSFLLLNTTAMLKSYARHTQPSHVPSQLADGWCEAQWHHCHLLEPLDILWSASWSPIFKSSLYICVPT